MNHIIRYNATRGRQSLVCFCGGVCQVDGDPVKFYDDHIRCGRFVEEKKWSSNN